jgi:acyl carrier protein
MTTAAAAPPIASDAADEEAGIAARIDAILRDELKLKVPSPDTDLLAAGLIDSLALVNLIFHLEQTFSVTTTVDDLDPDNFATVERMTRFVQARRAAGAVG